MKTYEFKYPHPVTNTGTGFETKSKDELRLEEISLLRQAKLIDLAPIEAWAAIGSNIQINYSTHGLFRYFGKFPATVATYLISTYSDINGQIMDPMCGSGTTAVECLLMNRKCYAFDINPLSVLLSKVKTTNISKKILMDCYENIIDAYRPLTPEEYDWNPIGVKNIDHWFLAETQNSLRGLIKVINEIDNTDVKDFFLICLNSCVRSVSRATSQQGRLFLDALSAKPDALDTFKKKALKAMDRVSLLPINNGLISIAEHNCLYDFELEQKNTLVICHPPYFNSYKYSSVNSLELAWMRINHADIRKDEVHEFFKVGKAENVNTYVDDMVKTISVIEKTIATDGVLALMIGDTIIKGEYIPATRMIIDALIDNNSSLKVEKIALRVPKFTEASWAASQRRQSESIGVTLNDFIIIFRRK